MIEGLLHIHIDEVDSTNTFLRSFKAEQEQRMTLVTATNQTGGRGQRGNSWESEPGKNVVFSLMVHPRFVNPMEVFALSEAIALAVCQAVEENLGKNAEEIKISEEEGNKISKGNEKNEGERNKISEEEGNGKSEGERNKISEEEGNGKSEGERNKTSEGEENKTSEEEGNKTSEEEGNRKNEGNKKSNEVTVKWPNDIYVGEKKICGILIENTLRGSRIEDCIIGVGLNVNQRVFRSDAPNPVSLYNLTGTEHSTDDVLQNVLERFDSLYKQLEEGRQEEVHEQYMQHLFRRTGIHKFSDECGEFCASIAGVEPSGHIVLLDTDGKHRRYAFKEVEYKIPLSSAL